MGQNEWHSQLLLLSVIANVSNRTNNRNLCPNNGILVICLAVSKKLQAKGNMIHLVGNGKSSLWPGCSLCIYSPLGFNAFCQIPNFTTKRLITLWHFASGKVYWPRISSSHITPVVPYIREPWTAHPAPQSGDTRIWTREKASHPLSKHFLVNMMWLACSAGWSCD